MDYKKNREFNLLSKTRKKICLLPDEKEKMLPHLIENEPNSVVKFVQQFLTEFNVNIFTLNKSL